MAHLHEVSFSLPASLQAQGAPASLSVPLQLFIDNKFHDGATARALPWFSSPDIAQGKTFSVVNPSTEEVITNHVAEGP